MPKRTFIDDLEDLYRKGQAESPQATEDEICRWIDEAPMQQPVSVRPEPKQTKAPASSPQVIVVHHRAPCRSSDVAALLLSLLWPGLGQLYRGDVLGFLVWPVVVLIAYFMFIPLGFFVHLACILGAAVAR